MEKEIKIKTKDNFIIYGILNGTNKSGLIIFVHGLTGHKNEHHFFNAAKFFTKRDYSTFRFDLYSGEKNSRLLRDCAIETHSDDLNTVISHFNKKFKKIYLVGHSLGGPTIINSNLDKIESIVLWDPSLDIYEELKPYLKYNKILDLYVLAWGTEFLLSKKMMNSFKSLKPRIVKRITKPVKIICAGKEGLFKIWKKALKSIEAKNKLISVPNATHCFDEEGTEEKLFDETLKWFDGEK